MKKSIIYAFCILAIALVACEPIEERDSIGGAISADQLDIKATPIVVNGKKSNMLVLENHSPVNSFWNCSPYLSTSSSDTVLLVIAGNNTIKFTGLNPDGSIIKKELIVSVDELTFPVPPEWGYLCGSGEKSWVWDNTASSCFGNGGYKGNVSPGWWTVQVSGMDEQAAGEGDGASMVFSLDGSSLIKKTTTNITTKGSFKFDMSQITKDDGGNIWSKGKLTTTGVTVLAGISINENKKPVNEYDILSLDNDKMVLSYHAQGTGSWGEAWFWLFRKADN